MKTTASRLLQCLLACLLVCLPLCGRAAPRAVLPPRYAQWLHQDVVYLITDDEKKAFFQLKSDDARDKFIETFWQIRNPDPLAPTNEAKETHYQRLAYANAHFGDGNVQDGWQSDRGMVYITLGAPKQIQKYPENRELKSLQIWFYQDLSGALPVDFYLLFYKPSPAEDYQLYSPYQDRPQALISSTNAVNDDRTAIKIIKQDIDDEAAHVALSLIPGEPVSLNDPYPSLQSDVLLNNIRNYRNLPAIRELVAARRMASEDVTHRIVLGEQFSDLIAVATRDGGEQSSIRYLFRLLHPEDFSLAEQDGGRYYYSLRLETKLTTAGGRVIYDRTQALSQYVPSSDLTKIKTKCFGVEGRVAAPSGRYQLNLVLTNLTTKEAFRQSRAVVVPGAQGMLGISQVFFAEPSPPQSSSSAQSPFSFAGLQLQPIGADGAVIDQGEPLRTIFQLWMAPGTPAALQGNLIHIHYLIGRLNGGAKVELDQQVDRGGFTPEGNLLMGKDFQTDALTPGFYRLVIKATNPADGSTAFQSLNFQVRDSSHPVAQLWTVKMPEPAP